MATVFRYIMIGFGALALFMPAWGAGALAQNLAHGHAMHGEPKYSGGFQHFDYVNPKAPKGGVLRQHAIGTFDSLNPYILKGVPASGLTFLGSNLLYESLTTQSLDEPFSQYGLIAQSVHIAPDKSWVEFHLNPKAKWHDGRSITAEDVVWSFDVLLEKGTPFFKAYYADVIRVETISPLRVKFHFAKNGDHVNAELPMIMGQMSVLPKHYWTEEGPDGQRLRDFSQATLEPPLGSGPYKISEVKPGASVTYERVKDWWGADLPVNRGRYNFDKIIYDYYRDSSVALEAFFSGEYDVRLENVAKSWETAYHIPQVKSGEIVKSEIQHSRPSGMNGFVFNIRRDIFKDHEVRKALQYAFDFEWSNQQFAYGAYSRTGSFFDNSELASAAGKPTGRVRDILESIQDKGIRDTLERSHKPPVSDGNGLNRKNLRQAVQVLNAAGYDLNDQKIRQHKKTGQKLEFTILTAVPEYERWVQPFVKNLERIGVRASLRVVDPTQYQNRVRDFDFDMVIASFPQSSSPGNEQRDFWSSEKADIKGSRNIIGVQDMAVDAVIDGIINAPNRAELVAWSRALDRLLLSGHYVIPMFHYDKWRVAYQNYLKRPKISPLYSLSVTDTWWDQRAENLNKR